MTDIIGWLILGAFYGTLLVLGLLAFRRNTTMDEIVAGWFNYRLCCVCGHYRRFAWQREWGDKPVCPSCVEQWQEYERNQELWEGLPMQ